MTREEILAKSRKENKNKDMVAYETEKLAGRAAVVVAALLCGILYFIQLCNGGGVNFALWAVVIAMQTTIYIVKAIRTRQKIKILLAILCTILTLCLSVVHTITVINNSPALWSNEQMAEIEEMVN